MKPHRSGSKIETSKPDLTNHKSNSSNGGGIIDSQRVSNKSESSSSETAKKFTIQTDKVDVLKKSHGEIDLLGVEDSAQIDMRRKKSTIAVKNVIQDINKKKRWHINQMGEVIFKGHQSFYIMRQIQMGLKDAVC